MSAVRVRRPIHRGSVLAAGLFVDAGSMGVEAARARLLGAMGAGARVFVAHRPASSPPGGPPAGPPQPAGAHADPAAGKWIIACLRAPVRMATTASPAGLLVRYGDLLSSAPLEEDEIGALNTGGPAAVIVAGGEAAVLPLDEAHREDPAAWIDVSDFEVPGDIVSLGNEQAAPAVGIAARRVDVRASLGVEAAPPELARIRKALLAGAGRGERAGAEGAGRGERSGAGGGAAGARRAGAWGRLLARLFAGLAAVLERLLPAADSGSARGGTGMEKARSGKALAVREAPPAGGAPGPSWLSALSRGLRALAARALVWSRLASVVGRRQAEYLSRMLEMFERGDLESALRHAIPLGGGDGGEAPPPALGALSPRSELTISPARARALTALYSGPNLLTELRLRYRRAFEQLEQAGDVEKAAFVLAELLGAHEEAVSFLERHGRLRLAAEIAEARGLPPGLVVRQWFLAGDARRAIRLARVHGAFADAVHRLEASGRAPEATALRLAWADALADAGQLAAAVQVIWPVVEARPLAAAWLDRAIALGGPIAAQMVLRKARLFPETFPDARDRVLALLREPGEEGALITRALAAEIHASRGEPSSRALATPVLRALLRGGPPGDDEGARRTLAESMADANGDALIREELRLLWQKKPEDGGQARVAVLAEGFLRGAGKHGVNEDALLRARLSPPDEIGKGNSLDADVRSNGFVLGVLDGMGGYHAGDWAAQLAASAIAGRLREAFGRAKGVSAWADALREAVVLAGRAVHDGALADVKKRGGACCAAVVTAAEGTLIVAHAGNCRAYLCRAGKLTALTRDHTLINESMKLGAEARALRPEEIPPNVVTRALGATPAVEVDVATVPLCEGDVLLLCTDGVWEAVPEDRIAPILSRGGTPRELCEALRSEAAAAGEPPNDDQAAMVACFSGRTPGVSPDTPVVVRPHPASEAVPTGPLRASPEPRLVRRGEADAGALAIHDAAELPDGRLLVALGELGAWLVSREGRVLARFAEPAEHIVMSDQGDRALLLARRGEATRIARLDLVRRRKQAWCDARITSFARDFDGSMWYVALEDTLYSIDATQAGWEHLWQSREPGAWVHAVARDGQRLSAVLVGDPGEVAVWTWDLPSHRLRSRDAAGDEGTLAYVVSVAPSGEAAVLVRPVERPSGVELASVLRLRKQGKELPLPGPPPDGARRTALSEEWIVTPSGEGGGALDVLDTDHARPRLRVELAGARPAGRIRGDHLLAFDDRGRLLVISLRTGGVIREIRLS